MTSQSEMTTVRCLGCSRTIRVPLLWIQEGKVTDTFCSVPCNLQYVRKAGMDYYKQVVEPRLLEDITAIVTPTDPNA